MCVSIDVGNGKLPVDEKSRLFCNMETLKRELIENALSTIGNDMDDGWKG
jgi:hypothetical protein